MNNLSATCDPHTTAPQVQWIELIDHHREDGEFSYDRKCQLWLSQLRTLMAEELGNSPRIRIHGYRHANRTYLAIDAFDQALENFISITALLDPGHMHLHGPIETQFDIALPGILDGLTLASELLRTNPRANGGSSFMWVEDKPVE